MWESNYTEISCVYVAKCMYFSVTTGVAYRNQCALTAADQLLILHGSFAITVLDQRNIVLTLRTSDCYYVAQA